MATKQASTQQSLGQQAPKPPTQPAINPETGEVRPEAGSNGDKRIIPAKAPATNVKTLQAFFNQPQVLAEVESFAKGFMKPEALLRTAIMAMSRTPLLARCSLSSFTRAFMDASALRIRPGGLNGRGYLVPRKNGKTGEHECHLDPGWRGLIDVARRSKQIKSIGAIAVREGDEFDYGYFPLPKLHWKPLKNGDAAREIIAAFAVAELQDGAVQIEVIERDDLDKIRKSSAAESGPWNDWPSEMARKSAVKRLCKYLPTPDDFDSLETALAVSDAADTGDRTILEVSAEDLADTTTQAESIAGQLAEKQSMSAADQLDALEREAAEAAIG
jgi:recombination protein RecT